MKEYKILVIIDMQNDFITGVFGTKEAQEIVPKMVEHIQNNNYDWIFYTQDTHYKVLMDESIEKNLPIHCMFNSPGWEIVEEIKQVLEKINHKTIIIKEQFMELYWSKFFDAIKELFIGEKFKDIALNVDICGLCTDICVIENAFLINQCLTEGLITIPTPVKVLSNLCAGTTPEMHQKALDIMKNNLIEIIEV